MTPVPCRAKQICGLRISLMRAYMTEKESIGKRRGGSALLIIFLIFGLALLLFIFLIKQFDIKLVNRASASIEKGIAPVSASDSTEDAPEVNPRLVSMVYVIDAGRMTSCFVQVMNAYEKNIFYIEIPLNARLDISTETYKELLTYAPTLPQYVKLSGISSYFSDNYRYEACTEIIAENLGIKLSEWAVMAAADFDEFMAKETEETADFFDIYSKYADTYRNSMSTAERWAYYEIYDKSEFTYKGSVPGQWSKTDFYINAVQTREIIEELKY